MAGVHDGGRARRRACTTAGVHDGGHARRRACTTAGMHDCAPLHFETLEDLLEGAYPARDDEEDHDARDVIDEAAVLLVKRGLAQLVLERRAHLDFVAKMANLIRGVG